VVEIEGIIVDGPPPFASCESTRTIPPSKAVILRVNSPGRVVAPTQEIFAAIQRVRKGGKPVIASFGAVAASGGYYVATAGDRIYANPGTLTGSIGVVMQMANIEGLLKKVGVDYVVVKAGSYKDIGNFARTHDAGGASRFFRLSSTTSTRSSWTPWPRARSRSQGGARFADGRIYPGQQAQALKMVDDSAVSEDAGRKRQASSPNISGRPKLLYPRKRSLRQGTARKPPRAAPTSALLPTLPGIRTPSI